jgi:hypothetical protein
MTLWTSAVGDNNKGTPVVHDHLVKGFRTEDMKEMCHGRRASPDDLHRILITCIHLFDSAISLLGEPSPEGVKMPSPASIVCMARLLESLGVGDEEDGPPLFYVT